ncbi:MAG: CHASE3 domain-containing protein [Vicinamibacterales bacterium]
MPLSTDDGLPQAVQRHRPISLLIGLAIALPFVTSIVAAGVVLARQTALQQSMALVTGTFEIRYVSEELRVHLTTVQSASRGYVLTGRREFLEPFEGAARDAAATAARLAMLVRDVAAQRERAATVQTLVTERLALARSVIDATTAGRVDDARREIESGRGLRLTNRTTALAAEIDEAAGELLRTHEAQLAGTARQQGWWLTGLLVSSAAALVALLAVVKRARAYEEIVRMCAWSQTIEYKGAWMSFEDYLAARFGLQTTHGISPEAARKVREEVAREVAAAATSDRPALDDGPGDATPRSASSP